jgi:hypothetical protein
VSQDTVSRDKSCVKVLVARDPNTKSVDDSHQSPSEVVSDIEHGALLPRVDDAWTPVTSGHVLRITVGPHGQDEEDDGHSLVAPGEGSAWPGQGSQI